MIKIDLRAAQRGFFDVPFVMRTVDRATRRVLSKFGAFVRQRAKTSIRKRKTISVPGQPPSGHMGLLRQFILFSYDPSKAVVIGPTLLNRGDGKTPELLEHGGNALRKRHGKMRDVFYRPRPFMKPAFDAELKGLSKLWANAISR